MTRDLTLVPPPPEDGDPGPGEDVFLYADHAPPEDHKDDRVTDATLARWLGLQAARMGVLRHTRDMIHPSAIAAFEAGANLPATTRLPHGLTESERSHWIRELKRAGGAAPTPEAPALPVTIRSITQRADIGTSTRYDVVLHANGKDYRLRDLTAKHMLDFEQLRLVAFDALLVLPPLSKTERPLWLAEVGQCMATVKVKAMVPEESEAVDMRTRMLEMAMAARRWEYNPEDTRPIGLVHILRGELIGWPREPMKVELRSRIGKLSNTNLPRAVESLGWAAREWRYDTRSVYVWCTTQERWAKIIADRR